MASVEIGIGGRTAHKPHPYTMTVDNAMSSPWHTNPSPWYPVTQAQEKAPSVFSHVALPEQLCVASRHSSTSSESVKKKMSKEGFAWEEFAWVRQTTSKKYCFLSNERYCRSRGSSQMRGSKYLKETEGCYLKEISDQKTCRDSNWDLSLTGRKLFWLSHKLWFVVNGVRREFNR